MNEDQKLGKFLLIMFSVSLGVCVLMNLIGIICEKCKKTKPNYDSVELNGFNS